MKMKNYVIILTLSLFAFQSGVCFAGMFDYAGSFQQKADVYWASQHHGKQPTNDQEKSQARMDYANSLGSSAPPSATAGEAIQGSGNHGFSEATE